MSKASIPPTATRGNYSRDELADMYALTKMWLETGQLKKAESVARGLTTVAPEYVPGWLAMSVVESSLGNVEQGLEAARKALKIQPNSAEAMILVVTTALTIGDMSTAGTYLGEIGEMVEQGKVTDPNLLRLFKMQMARYGQGK